MSAWFVRILLFIAVCLAIAHTYPSSMSKHKWLQEHLSRPYALDGGHTYDYLSSADGGVDNQDANEIDGFAPWLFRSRKFCCAPPL